MLRQLLVIAGPEKGRVIALPEGDLVIGRGEASQARINDPRISRVHCRLMVRQGRVMLVDAGSSGGTFVAGERITQCELTPGAVWQIGDTQLRYEAQEAAGQPSSASANDACQPAAAKDASQPPPRATDANRRTVQAAAPAKPPPRAGQPTALAKLVGQSFSDYRLEKILHKGNTSMVFQAHDQKRNRPAAVKVLDPAFTANDEQRDRFVRAMQTMLNIRHDNLVELYGAGKQGPHCWCAMELIEGSSLLEIIDMIGLQGMLDWRESYRVAVQISRALTYAHQHKIIHRNVTPQNLLQRQGDRLVKLCDLMLAKALEGAQARQVTAPGQMVGDLAYMSPERMQEGAEIDWRSDQYGLGATLYALLTGRPPFEAESLPELLRAVRQGTPARPEAYQPEIDQRYQEVVLTMLAKNPDDRFRWPADLQRELEKIGKALSLTADDSPWI